MPAKNLQKKKRLTVKDEKGKQPTFTYLKSAPTTLVALHSDRQNFPGRKILGCLLSDIRMQRAWTELGKRVEEKAEWERLWKEICYILKQARKGQTLRSEEKKPLLDIANKANSLSQSIREGPLDLRSYELFSDEVMNILGVTNWEHKDSLRRSVIAHELLKEWPTVPEMLAELASRAQHLSEDAMTKDRVVERRTLDYENLYFVRALVAYLERTYQAKLCGTVARITNVVLESEINSKFVEKALIPPQ